MADAVAYTQAAMLPVIPGLTHLLSVDSNPQSINGVQYHFTGWSNAVSTAAQSLVVNSPTSLTANFAAAGLGTFVTHSGNFTLGQSGAVYTVTVNNFRGAPTTSGLVTVTETLPAGLSLAGMSGAGWNCSVNTCTRSDGLNPGSRYPVITVKVNVS
jgi:uncharacterized repeat protein (TIGR01451 family)